MSAYDGDPNEFVEENREALLRILKRGDDEFVRALALSALIEFGQDPDLEDVERELRRARDREEGAA